MVSVKTLLLNKVTFPSVRVSCGHIFGGLPSAVGSALPVEKFLELLYYVTDDIKHKIMTLLMKIDDVSHRAL